MSRKAYRSAITVASGCAAVLVLVGATAMPASASYLGYGNGDPGNWDFWTEQKGGPAKSAVAMPAATAATPVHHAQHHAHHEAAKQKSSQG